MLDREVIKEFLDEELKESGIKIPKKISKAKLVEAFCRYVEDDYYDWIKENLQTFLNYGDPDWDWIKERIEFYSKEEI